MDEWELMKIAEDFEQGDYVRAVNGKKKARLMVVSEDSHTIMLKAADGSLHQFGRSDLSDRYGWTVVGKAKS